MPSSQQTQSSSSTATAQSATTLSTPIVAASNSFLSPNSNIGVEHPAAVAPGTTNVRHIDPFVQRQAIRARRNKQQISSRFITSAIKELEPLPSIKGK